MLAMIQDPELYNFMIVGSAFDNSIKVFQYLKEKNVESAIGLLRMLKVPEKNTPKQ